MLDKLARLGASPISIPEVQKADQLASLEAQVGSLPDDYRKLLLYFGGDIEFNALIVFRPDVPSPWASSDGMDALEMLYGLASKYRLSALEMYETYRDRIPARWMPIGAAPGGNQICLYIGDSTEQPVGFWDHESEVGPDMPSSSYGMTAIAGSLREFIDRLRPEEPPKDVPDNVKVDLHF